MTVPVATKSSSRSGPDELAFHPWIEMVAEVRSVRPNDRFDIVVIFESFENELEKS